MAKKRTYKQLEHLKGRIKQLEAENKRLKKEPLDKEEVDYDEEGNDTNINLIECVHCKTGMMQEVYIAGRNYYKCLDCDKTLKKKD